MLSLFPYMVDLKQTAKKRDEPNRLTTKARLILWYVQPNRVYHDNKFEHFEGADKLVDLGFASRCSYRFAGPIRGVILNTAGEILREELYG